MRGAQALHFGIIQLPRQPQRRQLRAVQDLAGKDLRGIMESYFGGSILGVVEKHDADFSPLSLGGLVLRVKVVYDTNGDGQFIDPSVPGNTGTDEAYNAAMLILPRVAASDVGRQGGASGADGLFDNNDFVVFIDLFFTGC